MNQITFIVAILVFKGVLTPKEGDKLVKSVPVGAISSNLSLMHKKVSQALKEDVEPLPTVDAKDFFKK